MSPFTFSHILHQRVHDWASRQSQEARERNQEIPPAVFIDKLGGMLGVTKRQVYRYLGGECTPPADTLVQLCRLIESTGPVEWLAREVGLGFYRRAPIQGSSSADTLSRVAAQLKECTEAGQTALQAWNDNHISANEYQVLQHELEQAMDACMDLLSDMRAKVEAGLRR